MVFHVHLYSLAHIKRDHNCVQIPWRRFFSNPDKVGRSLRGGCTSQTGNDSSGTGLSKKVKMFAFLFNSFNLKMKSDREKIGVQTLGEKEISFHSSLEQLLVLLIIMWKFEWKTLFGCIEK